MTERESNGPRGLHPEKKTSVRGAAIRAFISIQTIPIQTYSSRCHGDSREGVCCLYRCAMYRFNGPYASTLTSIFWFLCPE